MTDPLDDWPAFVAEVSARLETGRAAYGDRSFAADPSALVAELEQEALDLAGWGYVLWCRLRVMREVAVALDAEPGLAREAKGRQRAGQKAGGRGRKKLPPLIGGEVSLKSGEAARQAVPPKGSPPSGGKALPKTGRGHRNTSSPSGTKPLANASKATRQAAALPLDNALV